MSLRLIAIVAIFATFAQAEYDFNCTCGIKPGIAATTPSATRIMGGSETAPNSHPWQALILSKRAFICGGVLIHPKFVLTTINCLRHRKSGGLGQGGYHQELAVVLGEHNRSDADMIRQEYEVIDVTKNKKFQRCSLAHDIALLELNETVPVTNKIMPVCLPFYQQDVLEEGDELTATGWGFENVHGYYIQTIVLHEVVLKYLPSRTCERSPYTQSYNLGKHMICAADEENGFCGQDLGGPLVWYDPSTHRHFLMGLAAHTDDCEHAESPGVYTNVGKYLKWIGHKTNNADFCKIEGMDFLS